MSLRTRQLWRTPPLLRAPLLSVQRLRAPLRWTTCVSLPGTFVMASSLVFLVWSSILPLAVAAGLALAAENVQAAAVVGVSVLFDESDAVARPEVMDRAAGESAFAPMAMDDAKSRLMQWLTTAGTDDAAIARIQALWSAPETSVLPPEGLLDLVVASLAIADPVIQQLIEQCHSGGPVQSPLLDGARQDEFFAQSVQLYFARWMVQHRFYDEALPVLESLNPETSVDPASLFFYRAVCQQKLLQSKNAQDSVTLLLEATLDVPSRFRVVAEMMRDELNTMEEGGLPEVARVMSDVQRRLDLGRSGEQVQKQEDQVIALLDQLLEDMQQQQQQQSGGGGGGGGDTEQAQGTQGASQSTIKGSSAEGLADRRELTENGAWGLLDQQAETQAKELIRQQFPSNYLDAISRYTQKIAERK